ncbi:rab-interacting lysosomal [Lynx pardinus]|uniref:Rab-interacting lysosomal n=1 Tax=Lynx pardinus TaxID=191816 RepID=A0A485MW08_LYNPA|nr:rab-interacting lysosomal [Lynx pardinus]
MEPRGTIPGVPGCGPRVAAGSGTAAELVYHLAGALGTELKELARRFGGEGRGSPPHPPTPRLPSLLPRPQLQEQLQRLLLVNSELRHKLAAVQTQLRAARDRESERELQRQGAVELAQEPAQDQARGAGYEQRQEPERATAEAGAPGTPEDPPGRPSKVGQCSFSREELEQILQERNELKANVFLLKEELAYFQRELLTDHRVPGLLVEAMKVAVKKQRKKIKAKMLGIPEEAESSDDEDSSWLLLSSDKGAHPPPSESRIQSFFGLSYRGETEAPEAQTSSMAPSKLGGEEETPQPPHLEPVGSPTVLNS